MNPGTDTVLPYLAEVDRPCYRDSAIYPERRGFVWRWYDIEVVEALIFDPAADIALARLREKFRTAAAECHPPTEREKRGGALDRLLAAVARIAKGER